MAERYRWETEVEGIKLSCEYWPGPYNENRIRFTVPLADPGSVTGKDCDEYRDGLRLPSRLYKDYPVNDDPNDERNFYSYPGGQPHGPTCSFEVSWYSSGTFGGPANSPFTIRDPNLDKLCRQPIPSDPFVRLRPEVGAAIVASLGPVIAGAKDSRLLALLASERVPGDTRKEDWLPFVRAALTFWSEVESEGFDSDAPAQAFAGTGQRLEYQADFRRLTGRDWTPADAISASEVLAFAKVDRPAATPQYECLECGATFDSPEYIEPGGMGCDRCNSEMRRPWRRHLVTT
jgi:DNA-directed RNA polymerase subunit RPC12/RpoP